ncbi:MAG TPA: PrgI family protein [Candidatus Binatia bacterium]|nr:PrgI family protein [Candidatus Binatia bacterium]
MAVYKVIQDIEAEDKLIGPLGIKGLVYAAITVILGFINFKLIVSPLGPAKWPFVFIILLPMVLFAVLASPLGRDQPTEVWLLAHIRFFLKPHLRVWNQSGISHLVNVTVPKKQVQNLTKNLSQSEVSSRLQALATTLDSRGWAVKNVSVNLSASPGYLQDQGSDRLVEASNVVREVPEVSVQPADDILDAANNAAAQNMQSLMAKAEEQRREALQKKLAIARRRVSSEDEEFMQKHSGHEEKIHDIREAQSLEERSKSAMLVRPPRKANRVTADPQAAKLELAQSGNDLSVASIAKLANHSSGNEVLVALH